MKKPRDRFYGKPWLGYDETESRRSGATVGTLMLLLAFAGFEYSIWIINEFFKFCLMK